ncbi:2-keto-3-deoxygluconate oxidoreductase [Hyphodiscus hymeniophilus]|uniref:2-keto-3-deoxygluconate oxidoreductase n=1 Tax=Hyphodiscus hymeniophilus TaxID=353542 RepID=A0A9P6VDQ0_9HELO|nr:2-keto-3-deoxygluconate oxidoreductase [Hyphodiscus hymeniophilus]
MDSYLSNLFGLKDKTVLITGGTRGIGRSLAVALASAGADVILLARNVDSGLEVKEAIQRLGRKAQIYECDLSSRQSVLGIVPLITNDYHEIDIFVHCAGLQHRCPAEEFPDTNWDEIISVNVTAGFQLTRALAKHWLNTSLKGFSGDGAVPKKKVVFIASMTSFTGSVEIPAYTASKGAITQLTKALNNEWMAKGINVNAIAPGYIETELTNAIKDGGEKEKAILQRIPAGRWGSPSDLSGAVIHLCARSGDYIGGEIHAVDGGYLGR